MSGHSTVAEWSELRPVVNARLLREIKDRIVEAFDPERVVLFGSFADGSPDDDSDLDLLVVMDSKKRMAERIREVAAVAHVPFVPMDIIVHTPTELSERVSKGDGFIEEVLANGKELYRRVARR